jgi:TolB-like protein/class 3 adenylate cyclase
VTDAAAISRILTLVFTDLADSTGLKTQHGDQAVGELIARHRAEVKRLSSESGGRIIDWAGDGCFLTFTTPSAAVLFALRLQQLHAQVSDLPGVRTGIHLGEVSEEPGPDGDAAQPRVQGLAVDLAARISGLARPAQVLMSSAVADSARQRIDGTGFDRPIRWQAHGSYSLKGVAGALEIHEAGLEGVAPFAAPTASEKAKPAQRRTRRMGALAALVVAAVVAAILFWALPSRPPTGVSPPERKSIAVLPFVNMSSDEENEYFSDGITEDLITALSKLSGLRVAARTSSFAFKGKNEDIETIGEQLHVGAVLEGSVARAGNQVRITAQLINTADGYHLWSESYDRDLQDIFAIRSEVAKTVAKALQVALGADEIQTLEQKPTQDLEAYQLYLKGRHATTTLNDWDNAQRYLQQAVARDPSYALPYVGLAEYYIWSIDWVLSPLEACPRAREAAEKALQLDASLAEPHVWLAMARWWCRYDLAGARRDFETAIASQPDLSSVHEWYGYYLVANGEVDRGLTESRRAVELDPLSAHTSVMLGMNLFFAGHNDTAAQQLRTALTIEPDNWWARAWLGRVYAREGRFPEAIAELLAAQKVSSYPETASALGRIYADSGDKPAARRILNELRQRMRDEYVAPAYLATILVGLGETDQAFVALGQAYEQHSWYVTWWKLDPDLDPLRADPRFAALLKKVGQSP